MRAPLSAHLHGPFLTLCHTSQTYLLLYMKTLPYCKRMHAQATLTMCISILGSYGFFEHIKHCFACTWVGCHLEFSILYPSRKSHISRKRLKNAFVSVYVHMHEKYCKTYFYNGQSYLFFMSVTAVSTQQPTEFRDEVDKESKLQNKIYLLAELWGFVSVIINHIRTYKSIRSVKRAAHHSTATPFLQRRLIFNFTWWLPYKDTRTH